LGASLAAGADLILHAAGWLEFGRTVGLDKLRADEALLRASLSQATAVPA
jgi:trimethylamine:corrinoid methyltransferase-like protein